MKVLFSPAARHDLLDLRDFIKQNNGIERASAVIERILSRSEILESFPYSGPARDELIPGTRALIVTPWVTLYRVDVDKNAVEILRVIDGRRNLKALLGE